MTNWPDHTPEPGETPRWLGYGIVAALITAVLLWAPSGEGNWLPRFSMPQITLPEFDLPQASAPDATSPPYQSNGLPSSDETSASISEALAGASLVPTVQPMAFDDCVNLIRDMPNAEQYAIPLEDTPDRRVTRFKSPEGNLTITCSRADGTMAMDFGR